MVSVNTKSEMKKRQEQQEKQIILMQYKKVSKLEFEISKTRWQFVVYDTDEALQSYGKKSLQALKAIPTRRRLLITCDAVERDLDNLYWMMDLINPGCSKHTRFLGEIFNCQYRRERDVRRIPKMSNLRKSKPIFWMKF